jgi:hypothetical protein
MPRFSFSIAVGESLSDLSDCTSKVMSDDNMEVVRCRMHAFVDERINHAMHMAELVAACEAKKAMRERFLRSVPISDSQVTSLSVGQYVGVPPKEEKSLNEDLLDLRGDTTI